MVEMGVYQDQRMGWCWQYHSCSVSGVRRSWVAIMSQVGGWTLEISLNYRFKFLEYTGLDLKLFLKAGAHITPFLVDLPKGKHVLTNIPELVNMKPHTGGAPSYHHAGC